MIEKGQYVKIVFKNSTQLEGIVESWSDQQSVIKSINGDSLMVIFNTSADVMAVKIILNFIKPGELHSRLMKTAQEFEDVKQSPSTNEFRLQKLADLRKMLIEQEKQIINQQIREHTPSQTTKVKYGIPNFNKKHRAK